MTLSTYLSVADARGALAFYAEAFGAVPRGEPYVMPDGRIGHAELDLGGSLLMLADEFPEMGLVGPLARGGVSASLHLTVPDVDAVVTRAVAAGATLEREVADAPYGRTGVVVDPAGHRWMCRRRPSPPPRRPASTATSATRRSTRRTSSGPRRSSPASSAGPTAPAAARVGGRHGPGAGRQGVRPAGRVHRRPGDALPAVAAAPLGCSQRPAARGDDRVEQQW